MGFFSKIKQGLGFGGVSIKLGTPQVDSETGTITGQVDVTTKSELELLDLEVEVVQTTQTGRGSDTESEEFTLGSAKVLIHEMIKPGEAKSYHYEVIYERQKTGAEVLQEQGGALGKLGSLGKFASNEKLTFELKSVLDVKGVALDPSDSISLGQI